MDWTINAYSLIFISSSTATLVTAAICWYRREVYPAKSLSGIMLFVSLWALCGAVQMSVASLSLELFMVSLANILASFFLNLMMFFILDYFLLWPWLRPQRRWPFWVLTGLYALFEFSNPLHHLIYTGDVVQSAANNVVIFEYGPGYKVSYVYFMALALLSFSLLCYQIINARNWERRKAVWLILSLLFPLISYLFFFNFFTDRILGLSIMPLAFSISGYMVTWLLFEDMKNKMDEDTLLQQRSIRVLRSEVEKRQNLEESLKGTQDSLIDQLATQSRKLAGLYELILINSKSMKTEDMLGESLNNIMNITECNAVCYYSLEQGRYALFAGVGLTEETKKSLKIAGADWVPGDNALQVRINRGVNGEMPHEIVAAGFNSMALKYIYRSEQQYGLLLYLWQKPHSVRVIEIALMSALADELGVIVEHMYNRQNLLQNVAHEERRRLARDLHDSVTQSLYSLVYSADSARKMAKSQPQKLDAVLSHLSASALLALKEMRLMLYEMRLIPQGEINMLEAIETRLEAVERRAKIDANLTVEDGLEWPKTWEIELYPIVIESLNNSLKNAQASKVDIRITESHGEFSLCIEDNGKGFDLKNVSQGGMGLTNMNERAQKLGGRLKIDSTLGVGTKINVRIKKVAEAVRH